MRARFDALGIGDGLLGGLQARGWYGGRAGAGANEQKKQGRGDAQATTRGARRHGEGSHGHSLLMAMKDTEAAVHQYREDALDSSARRCATEHKEEGTSTVATESLAIHLRGKDWQRDRELAAPSETLALGSHGATM